MLATHQAAASATFSQNPTTAAPAKFSQNPTTEVLDKTTLETINRSVKKVISTLTKKRDNMVWFSFTLLGKNWLVLKPFSSSKTMQRIQQALRASAQSAKLLKKTETKQAGEMNHALHAFETGLDRNNFSVHGQTVRDQRDKIVDGLGIPTPVLASDSIKVGKGDLEKAKQCLDNANQLLFHAKQLESNTAPVDVRYRGKLVDHAQTLLDKAIKSVGKKIHTLTTKDELLFREQWHKTALQHALRSRDFEYDSIASKRDVKFHLKMANLCNKAAEGDTGAFKKIRGRRSCL